MRYNSTGTSPTYADTPLAFQLMKYILLAALIVWLILIDRATITIKHRNRYGVTAILFIVLQFLLYGMLTKNVTIISVAVILTPCLFFAGGEYKSSEKIEKLFIFFWWYSFLYELIQLFLFIRFNRLPALAYPTGKMTDVRFGGAWDDPNGYSLLMVFYIYYFFFKYKRIKQLFFVGASLWMLVFTWSGTGIITLVATAFILLLVRWNDKKLVIKYFFYGMLAAVLFLSIVAIKYSDARDLFAYYLQQKQGSIEQHVTGWDIASLRLLTYCGLNPAYIPTEVGYIRLVSIGGIPALIAFLFICYIGCKRYTFLLKTSSKSYPFFYGCIAYLIAFALFNVNLPHIMNFSCLGVFSCIISMSFCVDEIKQF